MAKNSFARHGRPMDMTKIDAVRDLVSSHDNLQDVVRELIQKNLYTAVKCPKQALVKLRKINEMYPGTIPWNIPMSMRSKTVTQKTESYKFVGFE